ncbi:MAG: GGDEF domain-containing protein [Eubacterium sp.]
MSRGLKAILDFFRSGITREQFRELSDEINAENQTNLLFVSGITWVILSVMFVLSIIFHYPQGYTSLYGFTGLVSFVVFLVAKGNRISSHSPGIILVSIYAYVSILMIFGIGLALINRDQQAVTFIAILLACPLFFTDLPVRTNTCLVIFSAIFLIVMSRYDNRTVFEDDAVNTIVFMLVSLLTSTHIRKVRFQKYMYSKKVTELSETDILTGMRNRNSYEKCVPLYAEQCQINLFCVFMDVNGLHEINNTQGHAAGDRMLQTIAKVMLEVFGRMDTYRIGGDEYVAFAMDADEADIRRKVKRVVKLIEQQNYHVAIGYASAVRPDINVAELICRAEEKMYERKNEYYSRPGNDRRSRR